MYSDNNYMGFRFIKDVVKVDLIRNIGVGNVLGRQILFI